MAAIIMLHGLPGSGKSYLASQLKNSIPDCVILKTVSMRTVRGRGTELFDENNPCTKKDKDESYMALCSEAEKTLKQGKIPILDATFHKRNRREWAYELAKRTSAKLIVISLSCSEKQTAERLKSRKKQNNEDAFLKSMDAHELMKKQSDPLTETINMISLDSEELNSAEVIRWIKNTLS